MIESRTLTSDAVPGHAPRLDAIHCLRGLAALAVCLLHVSVATTHHFPDSITTIGNLGGFGVPVFFVISGFVVPLSLLGSGYTIRSFPRFVLRRVTRLDPPYFAVLALALLSAYAVRLMRDTPFPYRFSDVALHVGYLTGLASRPWIEARHGDASASPGETFDAILVNAGVTHPLDVWLDALEPGGHMMVPITASMPAMGSTLGKGLVLLVTRDSAGGFAARVVTVVVVYSALAIRDPQMDEAIGKAMMAGPARWMAVKRLRHDTHEPDASCWLHGRSCCFSTV